MAAGYSAAVTSLLCATASFPVRQKCLPGNPLLLQYFTENSAFITLQ